MADELGGAAAPGSGVRSGLGRVGEGLLEVGPEILDVLDPDREAHEAGRERRNSFPQLIELCAVADVAEERRLPELGNGDIADDFMRLFYGPYAGAGNISRFKNADYDALYDKSRRTPDTRERNKLYESMTKIVSAQAPWCTNSYRISNTVVAPQIRGYRKNVHYFLTPWEYLDIDTTALKTRQ